MGNRMPLPVRSKGLQSDIGEPADLIIELEDSWTVLEFAPQENAVENVPSTDSDDDDRSTDHHLAENGTCTAVGSPKSLSTVSLTTTSTTDERSEDQSMDQESRSGVESQMEDTDNDDDDNEDEEEQEQKEAEDEGDHSSTEEAEKETNEETGQSSMEQDADNDSKEPLNDLSSPVNAEVQVENSCPNQESFQFEIGRCRTSSLNSRRERRRVAIADVVQRNFNKLVEQIDPDEVSRQLYPINVISEHDLEKATNKYVARRDRAHDLAMLISRKLRSKPEYFEDICTVLKSKGVRVVDSIKAQVLQKCPEGTDTEVEFSIGSFNKSHASVSGPEKMSTLLASVEGFCKTNGIKGVKEFIQSEVEKQPCATPFHDACKGNVSVQTLNILLAESEDYDINGKNRDGRTPLHVACASLRMDDSVCASSSGSMECQQSMEAQQECMLQQRMKIENLLKHKANCAIKDKDGNTPLHLATIRNDVNAVRLLLNYCTQCINIANERGNTALHIACREGMEDIIQELCDHKANAAIQNKKRERTPMHLACSCGRIPSAKRLAAYDRSTLDGRDKKKLTPLHITCKHNNTTLISELLQQTKCNPYKVDEQLKTPLHYACIWGNPDMVLPLLKCEHRREFLDAQDKFGDTALHIASRYGHKRIIKLLCEHKANKNLKNAEGRTPAQVAVDGDHAKAAEVLLRKRRLFYTSGKKAVKKLKRSGTVESLPSSVSDASDILFTSDESGLDETL